MAQGIVNAFTVDVEDYFHAANLNVPPRDWEHLPSRVEGNTRRLLELLAERGVRATFFVLGWVAERFPGLVKEIHEAGHEIGSHSYWHRLVYELTPEEFRADLVRSKRVLEDLIGERVRAYRAPTFSITERSLWALEVLKEEGVEIDSSIVPVYHDRYGIPHAPAEPYRVATRAGALVEVPPAVCRFFNGWNIPMGGGGYFRLLPLGLYLRLARRVCDHEGRPLVFYIHPWEIDPDQPRVRTGGVWAWRHRHGLGRCYGKLNELLSRLAFGPLGAYVSRFRPHRTAAVNGATSLFPLLHVGDAGCQSR